MVFSVCIVHHPTALFVLSLLIMSNVAMRKHLVGGDVGEPTTGDDLVLIEIHDV